MNDERAKNFKAAKQEAQQQQTAVEEKPQSQSDVVNLQAMVDFVANQQLTNIQKSLEQLAKQNENFQKRTANGLQIELQHYLDSEIVKRTAAVLKEHTERLEKKQDANVYYFQKINEKLEIISVGLAMIFGSASLASVYYLFLR